MFRNKNAVILFGLCSALAACDRTTEPESVTSQAAESATGSMGMLAASNTWATKSPLTPWRGAAGAGVINGIMYLAGGGARTVYTARVDAYNIATNTWSQVASMPAARSGVDGASVINGKLYVTGGSDRNGMQTRTLFVYNPATNSWTRKADMPGPSCGGNHGIIGGQLYVYTGCWAVNYEGAVFFRYNPSTNTWIKRAVPPADHYLGSGTAIGGKFYLNGGFTPMCGGTCGGNTHNLDVYNPATNTWTVRAGTGTYATTAAALNGKLYIIGGYSEVNNSEVQAYDPMTNTWMSRASLPEGSSFGTATTANGKLYYLEGATDFTAGPSRLFVYTP
jgi:N-acetylneuraminic acid mutarotase